MDIRIMIMYVTLDYVYLNYYSLGVTMGDLNLD